MLFDTFIIIVGRWYGINRFNCSTLGTFFSVHSKIDTDLFFQGEIRAISYSNSFFDSLHVIVARISSFGAFPWRCDPSLINFSICYV